MILQFFEKNLQKPSESEKPVKRGVTIRRLKGVKTGAETCFSEDCFFQTYIVYYAGYEDIRRYRLF